MVKLHSYRKAGISGRATLKYLGINLRKLSGLRNLPLFFAHLKSWREGGGQVNRLFPILNDFQAPAGASSGHYFHQDLLVAQMIFEDQPRRHVDVGSRIDGFVAHVAAFREIEFLDIRGLDDTGHANLRPVRGDITRDGQIGKADSVSCLHALEHFGLGRYGDLINPEGHLDGLTNIVETASKGGRIYLSFPIGVRDEVVFNAHRIFHPLSLLSIEVIAENTRLLRFDFVDDSGILHQNQDLESMRNIPNFGCGIYTFEKTT